MLQFDIWHISVRYLYLLPKLYTVKKSGFWAHPIHILRVRVRVRLPLRCDFHEIQLLKRV